MIVKFKYWLFDYYWLFSVGGLIVLIATPLIDPSAGWNLSGGILTVVLSFTFFLQKQKLDELSLFKSLFEEFNKRYHELNKDLNRLSSHGIIETQRENDTQILYNYFNLCSEEYLYFSRGYIIPCVWDSWLNGMRFYYRNPDIKKLWNQDLDTNSHYGFRKELLIRENKSQ